MEKRESEGTDSCSDWLASIQGTSPKKGRIKRALHLKVACLFVAPLSGLGDSLARHWSPVVIAQNQQGSGWTAFSRATPFKAWQHALRTGFADLVVFAAPHATFGCTHRPALRSNDRPLGLPELADSSQSAVEAGDRMVGKRLALWRAAHQSRSTQCVSYGPSSSFLLKVPAVLRLLTSLGSHRSDVCLCSFGSPRHRSLRFITSHNLRLNFDATCLLVSPMKSKNPGG